MKTYRSKEDWRKLKRIIKGGMEPAAFTDHRYNGDPLYEEAQTRKMKPEPKSRVADSIEEN